MSSSSTGPSEQVLLARAGRVATALAHVTGTVGVVVGAVAARDGEPLLAALA